MGFLNRSLFLWVLFIKTQIFYRPLHLPVSLLVWTLSATGSAQSPQIAPNLNAPLFVKTLTAILKSNPNAVTAKDKWDNSWTSSSKKQKRTQLAVNAKIENIRLKLYWFYKV
jgi:hypothetical protein